MDSIRASEALDSGSIPDEATSDNYPRLVIPDGVFFRSGPPSTKDSIIPATAGTKRWASFPD